MELASHHGRELPHQVGANTVHSKSGDQPRTFYVFAVAKKIGRRDLYLRKIPETTEVVAKTLGIQLFADTALKFEGFASAYECRVMEPGGAYFARFKQLIPEEDLPDGEKAKEAAVGSVR